MDDGIEKKLPSLRRRGVTRFLRDGVVLCRLMLYLD